MHRSAARLAVLGIAAALAACAGSGVERDGPGSGRVEGLPGDAVPRPEPRSRYGNGRDLGDGPKYEVLGKTYRVLDSSADYQERGVASWYGSKFHGRLTSNREVYDMYGMTAAHKTLPLPTYVRVRNLRNNKSIVVRVNDRGPFVHNRIIDLSYAAALKLDMVQDGTSLVEVTAFNFDAVESGERPVRATTPSRPPLVSMPSVTAATAEVYVQVGAFADRFNAARRLAMLSRSGVDKAFIHEDESTSPALFRVRIGPVTDVSQYDILVRELERLGITDPYLITE